MPTINVKSLAAAQIRGWATRTQYDSPSDGVFRIRNNALTAGSGALQAGFIHPGKTAAETLIFGGWDVDGAAIGAAQILATSADTPTLAITGATITGGSISGITDLAVADGGTGASTLTGLVFGNGAGAFTTKAIGVDVQAYDADLTTYAGITPSANVQTLLGSASFAAFRSSLGAYGSGDAVTVTDATLGASNTLSWTGRTKVTAPADGQVLATNAAGTTGYRLLPTGDGAVTLTNIAGAGNTGTLTANAAVLDTKITIGVYPAITNTPLNIKTDGSGNGFIVAGSDTEYTRFISGGAKKGMLGTGTVPLYIENVGDVAIASGTGTGWVFTNIGNLVASTDNLYDIGATGATRPRNIHIAGYLLGKYRAYANAVAETPTATHTLRIFDAAGTEYKVLCIAA